MVEPVVGVNVTVALQAVGAGGGAVGVAETSREGALSPPGPTAVTTKR